MVYLFFQVIVLCPDAIRPSDSWPGSSQVCPRRVARFACNWWRMFSWTVKNIARKLKTLIVWFMETKHLTQSSTSEKFTEHGGMGPMSYGIHEAAFFYFNKHPSVKFRRKYFPGFCGPLNRNTSKLIYGRWAAARPGRLLPPDCGKVTKKW